MAEKKATRMGYGEALADLGSKYDFFVMDADLSKSTMTDLFRQKHPDRFFNSGIAEANMMSVAAGMASTGTPVFVSSFAMFVCERAFEQIRNSVAYPHLNVKIGASHAGITVGEDGATHQCNEDIALMRSLPGVTIINPADAVEAYAAVEAALKIDGPVYLRLGRYAVPTVFEKENYEFRAGEAVVLEEGSDVAIMATGIMVAEALEARRILKESGIDAAVINVHTIKPLDEKTVIKYAEKCKYVVTAEEHSIIGGLGSAVCETIACNCNAKVLRIGIEDEFGHSGPAGELINQFGLNGAAVAEKIKKFLGK